MYRVTQSMLSNQVMFNLTRTPSRFFELQNMMSTNRRINKPSDDPIGTIRDLSYRERLADITQFKANISMGRTWMLSIDSALGDANNAAAAAYEIAVEMANDTYDATARMAAANQAQSLVDQIIEAANIQVQGRYLFSGYKTATRPFEVGAGGAVYQGDSGTIELSVDSNSRVQVNTIGADVFTKPFRILGEETDLQPGVTTTTLLSNLKNGQGIDLTTGIIKITDVNLNTTVSVDLNAAPLVTTVGDVINRINADLATGGITNVTASLGLEGNNIRLVATDNPAITDATPVANLNSGNGIDMEPGTFVIRNAAGTINQTIDISAATTIGELRTAIETQLGQPTVTVSINATNTGLEISDTGGLGLYVEDPLPSETTAADLGILGSIDPTLTGADLNPKPDFVIAENAVGETTAANLGILGTMNYGLIGGDLDPQLLGTTEIASYNNGNSFALSTIRITQGTDIVTIDTAAAGIVTTQDLIDAINNAGLTITASINAGNGGIQIVNEDPTKTLIVRNGDDSRTASSFGIVGATDVLGNMMLLVDALRDNDRETVENLVGSLNQSIDKVLDQRATVGAKLVRMEVSLNGLEDHEINYTKLPSDVEDADLTKLIIDLAMQENAYTAALNAAAKILQPSLLNFIR